MDDVIRAEREKRRLHYAETRGAPYLCGDGVPGDVETEWWPWVNCPDCWALRPSKVDPPRLSVVPAVVGVVAVQAEESE